MFATSFVACNKESDEVVIDNDNENSIANYNINFKADFEVPTLVSDLDETSLQKMKFEDNGSYKVSFEESDEISIWGESGYCSKGFVSVLNSSTDIDIKAVVKEEDKDGSFYALIPHSASRNNNAVSSGVIDAEIPSTQYAVSKSCDPRAFITCAYSEAGASNFHFKNATSMLKITTNKDYHSITIESLSGQLAGTIGIQMSGENVSNITLKDNTARKITLQGSNGMVNAGEYYVAVAPSTIKHTLVITCIDDDDNYSSAKFSQVEFKKSLVSKVNVSKYVHGEKCWYIVKRDGQLGVDLGMVVGGYRVYWAPYNYGATSYTDQGTLFGWGQKEGRCGETYEAITNYNDRYFPSNGNWKPASANEFDELLTGNIAAEKINMIVDVWKVTYHNRSLYFPRDVETKVQEVAYLSNTDLYNFCAQVFSRDEFIEGFYNEFQEIPSRYWINENNVSTLAGLLTKYSSRTNVTDEVIIAFIEGREISVPKDYADMYSMLYDVCLWCEDGYDADNKFYGNFVRIMTASEFETKNSFSYDEHIYESIDDFDIFENFPAYSVAFPYRMVYREPVVTLE